MLDYVSVDLQGTLTTKFANECSNLFQAKNICFEPFVEEKKVTLLEAFGSFHLGVQVA